MENIKPMKKMRYIKALFVLSLLAMLPVFAKAQKFALVDMEYVLKNIPAYERANEQLIPLSGAEENQAGTDHAEGEAGFRLKEKIFRSGRRALQEARKPDDSDSGRGL